MTASPAKPHRFGASTLTSLGLLVGAIAGLLLLEAQVPLWGFGSNGPDARSFPRVALIVLAGLAGLRLGLGLWRGGAGLGAGWFRAGLVTAALIAGLWAMPMLGFIPCAAGLGIVTALAFGERKPLALIAVPLIAAAIVGLGARFILAVPLP
ncbi:hypothetical protein [Pseudoprimorskyibacter insulae]|uniref:Tripartite tricarboxylate transporter TctB family protein n=1 Tax=Pseudoprimorskyibacter insulae TaxID=1695997 RepID=A0A2R8B0S9_9RHOB|nr:hypothetical protein [Pseudoprimorskyibacter insulae]SPF81754.1 hypothetical protein PRI8871_03579 [Pseudoprimorskyibacter insulae]